MNDPLSDSDENALVKLASLFVIGAGLVALFAGYSWFWIVFAVGFAVLVPAVKILSDELGVGGVSDGSTEDSQAEPRLDRLGADAPESKQDALDALRSRYASGELDEDEFERKVEHLLETETLEGARDHVARASERDHGEKATERDAEARDRDRATER